MPSRLPVYHTFGASTQAYNYDRQRSRREDKGFYSSARWRKFRAWFLGVNPLCVDCRKAGRVTAAEHVHHVIPRKTREDLAFEPSNCEPLCQSCHNAREVR